MKVEKPQLANTTLVSSHPCRHGDKILGKGSPTHKVPVQY